MEQHKKNLADKIIELTTKHWIESSEPLLLSRLGPDLVACNFDYKKILDGYGLRQFIDKEINELKVAQHPQQYAKIGVHPAGENFTYLDAVQKTTSEPAEEDKLRKSRRAFYGFIQAISELPPEDIEGINIPARVIIRLLEGK